jgi:ribosomal protein L18
MIQYAHNVCARTAWDAERLQGQKYGKKRKAKKVGRSFCKKSGFMRIEEVCFDTEGKKKGERVKRK